MAQSAKPIDSLHKRFAEAGQGHVFRFWDQISQLERENLAQQAAGHRFRVNFRGLRALQGAEEGLTARVEPPHVVRLPGKGGNPKAWKEALERGEQVLTEGKAAPFVVAGGQGTRLGFSGPKGSFPIGPLSQRSLFELQAQKIRRLSKQYGHALPWYVMTSAATDAQTREFFHKRSFSACLKPMFSFWFRP